jgi:hypothetical protein
MIVESGNVKKNIKEIYKEILLNNYLKYLAIASVSSRYVLIKPPKNPVGKKVGRVTTLDSTVRGASESISGDVIKLQILVFGPFFMSGVL